MILRKTIKWKRRIRFLHTRETLILRNSFWLWLYKDSINQVYKGVLFYLIRSKLFQ